MASLTSKPTLIEWGPLRFLIMDKPKDSNLHLYLKECKKHNVTKIVRICEPCYDAAEVEKSGLTLHELFYEDGRSPPEEVLNSWNTLVSATFDGLKASEPKPCIVLHCVAGLGRAPVLVAIALVEYGQDPGQAVSFIRERRRGAINAVQLQYLQSYKRRKKKGSWCAIL
jgi:protein tyrosine phosphatase type IVA